MTSLPDARSRLADLRAELEGFPQWSTDSGRKELCSWYRQMGWMLDWEARVLLREAKDKAA